MATVNTARSDLYTESGVIKDNIHPILDKISKDTNTSVNVEITGQMPASGLQSENGAQIIIQGSPEAIECARIQALIMLDELVSIWGINAIVSHCICTNPLLFCTYRLVCAQTPSIYLQDCITSCAEGSGVICSPLWRKLPPTFICLLHSPTLITQKSLFKTMLVSVIKARLFILPDHLHPSLEQKIC